MSNKKYKNPNITINKVYTRTGDNGKTMLVGGQKLSKDDLRVCAYGEIDELNSYIGATRESMKLADLKDNTVLDVLKRIQNELFNLGNMLATLSQDKTDMMPSIDAAHIEKLENDIDYYNQNLPTLNSFVLPGGSMQNAWIHISRSFCRRCERTAVTLYNEDNISLDIIKYLNRLSDFLFVLGRWVNQAQSNNENLWNPNKG